MRPIDLSLTLSSHHPSIFFTVCSPCGEQRVNVGLNLKFNKKNEEVPGYTKRTEKEWLYSVAVEELLAEYLERFKEREKKHYKLPSSFIIEIFMKKYELLCFFILFFRFSEVFNTVSKNSHDDIFYEDDIWPGLDQNG